MENQITDRNILASTIQKCPYEDSACIAKVTNEIVSKGKSGYPELGFPVFDPLKIEKMNIVQGGDGPVTLKLNLKNIELSGMSQMVFSKMDGFRKDFDKARIEMRFKYPSLNIHGPYKLDGRVLVLPVQGDGIINMTLCKLTSTMH